MSTRFSRFGISWMDTTREGMGNMISDIHGGKFSSKQVIVLDSSGNNPVVAIKLENNTKNIKSRGKNAQK